MTDRPTVFIVAGSTGAGKTTYAIKLAEAHGAMRFSIDEWMQALFWQDMPEKLDFAWAIERVHRCEAQIWATGRQAAQLGKAVVLDLGFTTAEQRGRFIGWATEAGFECETHFLDVPADLRRGRVRLRNAEQGATFSFEVTDQMFDFMEPRFEPPQGGEGARIVRIA